MSLKKFILERKNSENYFSYKGIEIKVKNQLPDNIDIKKVMKYVTSAVPFKLMSGIKSINVGQFSELNDRKIQAVYIDKQKSIYVTNKQDSQLDILDDIVHEIAHFVEVKYQNVIYLDGKLKNEFVQKRRQMWRQLQRHGFEKDISHFLKTTYDKSFDKFLYYELGYPIVASITSNIFNSPYAATSIREYFANGFEAFFLKEDLTRLKTMCPVLFNKMGDLLDVEDY